ncbi:MAG: hypothetical protein A3A24_02060 [Candidatus Buchananbacteria bacterium RIFCSPLOWO2_01_FULL_46_12]|uniref:Uncharacterized protein n=1 Tax=Candidatus Buchananbacteria bacterium RIFCSPLOWO2_01_FULL_46_12 TaxID=1797546 RepID=A0A1G1YU13_9BACT|nr:MAG: hypothetical protein A3A24_02060 [Candidatus Buchananbacteria bacterium RIFCSPLOWO2_01_FULL_46_12]
MKNRTVLIFSLFVLVALVVVIFIYFYRGQVDKLVDRYVDKIASCGEITSEAECVKNSFCEGIYGPSCPECKDLAFKNCQEVSVSTAGILEKEQDLCLKTGGEWYRNKLGSFCLCETGGANKIFSRVRGCVDR